MTRFLSSVAGLALLASLPDSANALRPEARDAEITFELRAHDGKQLGAVIEQHATVPNGTFIVPCLQAETDTEVRIEMWFEALAPVEAWPGRGGYRKLTAGERLCIGAEPSKPPYFQMSGRAGENGVRIIQRLADGTEFIAAGLTFLNVAEAANSSEAAGEPAYSGPPTLQACNVKTRVVGGDEALPGEYPWMVSLRPANDSQSCGGSLISAQWVLTAAHCFGPRAPEIAMARHGALIHRDGTRFDIEKVVSHPRYQELRHDIALVKLKKPVVTQPAKARQLSPLLALAPTQAEQALTAPQRCAEVVGWGRLAETGPVSDALQKLRVPLWHEKDCQRLSALYQIDGRGQLCAGYVEGKRDSCGGDSGGPLVVPQANGDWLQIGIVSYGDGCARANAPGVYTRVSHYRPWIDCVIKGGDAKRCDSP